MPVTIEGERLPTEVGYDGEFRSRPGEDDEHCEDDEHADELP